MCVGAGGVVCYKPRKHRQTNHSFVTIKAETKLKMLLNPTWYVEEVVYNKLSKSLYITEAHFFAARDETGLFNLA